MVKNKVIKMEYVWAFLAVLTFIIFVMETFRKGFSQSYIMGLFSVISVLMYLWRRSLRLKEEKNQDE